jgi:predicted dehydrogenase
MAKAKKSGKQVKVAIVGAGGRAQAAHYPALAEIPAAKLVAVCDLELKRAQAAGDKFGIPGRYTNCAEMIEKEKPDAVYAIMPPHHLYDVAAGIIERGCHLFIEKPPAVTAEQVRQLDLLAKKHKVLTGVTFQRRFSPLIRKGRELCAARGAVHTAHASFYKNWVGGSPYYKGAMDMLTCDGIHAVDTLRYLCGGEVLSVASDSRRLDGGHWNIHLALVRFSSGATGLLLNNFMAGRRIFSVEIHAPGISFFGDPEEGGKLFADNKLEPVQTLDPFALGQSREQHRAFGAYDTNLHFIECVQQGRQPETHFGDALKTMELVEAIYRSQI